MNSNSIKTESRRFEFDKKFLKEFDSMMNMYDKTYSELDKIVSKSTVDSPDEYGVCNNNYKLRYIKPENIATYVSYLMKALRKNLITYNMNDMEKFSVQMVKSFMTENKCIPIENGTIYGLDRYTSDTMTLRDLTILCENDIYHTSVCSKYDITQRKASMKSDWSTFTNIHYGTNIKKMVNSIPKLMESTEYSDLDMYVRDSIRMYVEEFILFSTMMNIITMSNMILYCVPKSTYNTALVDDKPEKIESNDLNNEGDDLFKGTFEEYASQMEEDQEQAYLESVDLTESKPIFVICCEFNPDDWTSRNISKVTKSKYSHIVFSLDPKLETCYEYHDKIDETIYGNKSGFHKADILGASYEKRNMAVYTTFVSNADFEKIRETIDDFDHHKTQYDKLILATKLFKLDKKFTKSQYKQVCSTFVDRLFKAVEINLTGKKIPSPAELQKSIDIMPENFIKLYDGPCNNYDYNKLDEKLKGFAGRDYVHEIKKNESYEAYTESVNTKRAKPIFTIVVEKNTGEFISETISKVTKSDFTHTAIALDPELKDTYAFDMFFNKDEESGNKNGFHKVDITGDKYSHRKMSVYATYVSNEDYDKIKDMIEEFKKSPDSKKYDVSILALNLLKIDKKLSKSEYVQVCSTFVDSLFKAIGVDLTGKNIPTPIDIKDSIDEHHSQFCLVYDGGCSDYNSKQTKSILKKFVDQERSKILTDTDDVVTESVDTSIYKPIFVGCLMGKDIVSTSVKKVTDSDISHILLALDPDLEEGYSFAPSFEKDPDTGNKTGFHKEYLRSEFRKNASMRVYATYITNENYKKLQNAIKEYKSHKSAKKYDFGMAIQLMLKNDKKFTKDQYKQICSTFVDQMFKIIGVDLAGMQIPAPGHLTKAIMNRQDEFILVYDGPCNDYDADHARDILDKFVERKHSKPLAPDGTVVTECCLLKTNKLVIHNKIPFNINMRNIVLEDMHPQFKDTLSAIHFITTDSRSPISQLLIKYSSDDKSRIYADPMTIINLFSHNRYPFDAMKDVYAKHHEMDFHTDVNWLDKIAYGNNYLNGNYRTDGMGNHHMDPVSTSLDNLYKMYCGCDLVESKDLADHIIKISRLMESIIHAYREYKIENWEIVRDILAVLGEIMTRSMIKLYDNHMTVFVARDNMDDTGIPGYMYTEAFVMEADEAPRVEVDGVSNDGKVKAAVKTVTQNILQFYTKFLTWIQQNLQNGPFKFMKDHKPEIDAVKANNENGLNAEIGNALNHSFNITITNFPEFNIPQRAIFEEGQSVASIVDNLLTKKEITDPTTEIKSKFYPRELASHITNTKGKQAQEYVSNFFLYGKCQYQKPPATPIRLTKDQWDILIKDIVETGPLLEKDIKKIADDLTAAVKKVEAIHKDTKSKLDSAKAKQNGGNNNTSTSNSNEVTELEKKTQVCESIMKALQDVSAEYGCALLNVISSKFYGVSYTMYHDIVIKYKQQKNTNNTNQQQNANTQQTGGSGNVR
jgi:hypothetical protein